MTNNKRKYFQLRGKEEYFKKKDILNVRARSYYKLEQIDKKFNLIKNNLTILDLGCAPGGWLEYIEKKKINSNIYGIDLLEVKNKKEFSQNINIIQDDFENINNYIDLKFDLIISDMAPEFSGNIKLDKGKTHKLNIKTIQYSIEHLKSGGNLLFKTFEGEDLDYVRNNAKKYFQKITQYKPRSSQTKSAETFILCFNKKISKEEVEEK